MSTSSYTAAAGAAAFRVPGPGPYLATHSVGCLTNAAVDALQAGYLDPWQQRGADAWEPWLAALDGFRAGLATLLGGKPEDYCPQTNLSAALSALIGSLPRPSPDRNVWLAAEDCFPSLGFVLRRAERLGVALRLIPRAQDPGRAQTWIDALRPDVCGVLVTHAFSNSGTVAPAGDIARQCRAAGVLSVIDVAQSAGILPLSVERLDADVVIGSCVKWLCGGPGAGFLWIRAGLAQRLEPTDIGWFSHANPFEMDIHAFRDAAGAQRFWGGTPSVAPYVMAAASLRVLADFGIDTIRGHNRALQAAFHGALPPAWRERVRLEGVGGTLCIRCGDSFGAVRGKLLEQQACFDSRADTVRLSFHLCNSAGQAQSVARAWDL